MTDAFNPIKPDARPGTDSLPFSRDMYCAWLFRTDVRKDACLADEQAQLDFLLWWYVWGRQHYVAARTVRPEDVPRLNAWVSLDGTAELRLTRLAQFLWRIRTDVQAAYPLHSSADLDAFWAWFWVYGVAEQELHALVAPELIEAINQPDERYPQDAPMPFTRLMHALHRCRQDLQSTFQLTETRDRLKYVAWFYLFGVAEQGLGPLIAPATVAQLMDVAIDDTQALAQLVGLYEAPDAEFLPSDRVYAVPPLTLNTLESAAYRLLWLNRQAATVNPEYPIASPTRRDGVNLIGYARGELGIGEDLRAMAAALEDAGIPFTVLNLSLPGHSGRQRDDAWLDTKISDQLPYRVNLWCLTGLDIARIHLELGDSLFRDHRNIGYWQWELNVWPRAWQPVFALVDEIWVASRFVQESLAARATVPVIRLPAPVILGPITPISRAQLGLPENTFLFLFAFDFNSYLARKNPWGCLDAFRMAFPAGDEPVGLVIKVMNADQEHPLWRAFLERCAEDCRVHLLQNTLERGQMLGLLEACDAVVSLHRAEGFGRMPAEAMLLSRPVILTDYSGTQDYALDATAWRVPAEEIPVLPGEYPFSDDESRWAAPDLVSAALAMREQQSTEPAVRALRAQRLVAAHHWISEHYSARTCGQRFLARLQTLGELSLQGRSLGFRPRAIHQYSINATVGDGVTQGMLFTQRLLRELGYASEIYCIDVPKALFGQVRSVQDYRSAPDQVLLYHHAIGHNRGDWIETLPDFKVLVYHNITPPQFFPEDSPLRRAVVLGREMLAGWTTLFDGAIGDSECNSQELRALGFPRAQTLPLLVDLERLLSQPWDADLVKRHQNRFTLLFVGRLVENKCQHQLIEALHCLGPCLHRPVELILVGGTESSVYRQRLERLIVQYQLQERVILAGKVSEPELYGYYRAANLYLSLSEHEGFGMPLIEAMVFDVPVFAYAAPGTAIAETLGTGGRLFPDPSPERIARAIEHLAGSPAERSRLVQSQRQNLRRFAPNRLKTELTGFLQCLGLQTRTYPARGEPLQRACRFQIEGPFDSSYSLAILNREMARSLLAAHLPVSLKATEGYGDLVPSADFLEREPVLADAWRRGQSVAYPDIVLRNLYPPRTDDMRGRLNLFHNWGWEESAVPADYIACFNRDLNGLTVMSHFVRKVLEDHGVKIPIRVVGVGVDHRSAGWRESSLSQGRGRRRGVFRFLHLSSGFPRKGVDVLLKAYAQTFVDADPVELIVKTFPNPHQDLERQLRELRAAYPRCPDILWINRDLSDDDLTALFQDCDALVAPSRGEGFGLPLAEAMWHGKPVITTAYGGQMDFCDAQTAWLIDYQFAWARSHFQLFDSVWAEPDAGHLSALMMEVFRADSASLLAKTTAARERIVRDYRWSSVRERTVAAIAELEAESEPARPVGLVSTWSSHCGIAEYSQMLLGAFVGTGLQVFAEHQDGTPTQVGDPVQRCWRLGGQDDLQELTGQLLAAGLGSVLIQFQFAFFRPLALGRMLERLREAGLRVFVLFHSTAPVQWGSETRSLAALAPVLATMTRLLVHGVADLNYFKSLGLVDQVMLFPHAVRVPGPDTAPPVDAALEPRLLSLQRHSPVLASFGFLLPHKGLRALIEALAIIRQTHPQAGLLLLNALHPDPRSQAEHEACQELIVQLDVADAVLWVTDYWPLTRVYQWLRHADALLFPYADTQESSSAAVRVGLATGKPVFCTRGGIFDNVADLVNDIPSSAPADIALAFHRFWARNGRANPRKALQQAWIDTHDAAMLGQRLMNVLQRNPV